MARQTAGAGCIGALAETSGPLAGAGFGGKAGHDLPGLCVSHRRAGSPHQQPSPRSPTTETPGSSRTPLIHPAPFRAPRILLVVIGRRSASAPASPSRGPGNGILRAETGGRIQAQTAGERSEFGSQTATRRTVGPKLRGFLCTRNCGSLPGRHGGRSGIKAKIGKEAWRRDEETGSQSVFVEIDRRGDLEKKGNRRPMSGQVATARTPSRFVDRITERGSVAERGQSQEQPLGEQGLQNGVR